MDEISSSKHSLQNMNRRGKFSDRLSRLSHCLKYFANMGVGTLIGVMLFLRFLFAALTSTISPLETSISTLEDELRWSRPKCCLLMAVVMLVVGTASSLGYGIWDGGRIFGMLFLDFFDFLTNSVMMPIAAFAICFLIFRA